MNEFSQFESIAHSVEMQFRNILCDQTIDNIKNKNWVEFYRRDPKIWGTNQIMIVFLEKNTEIIDDTIINCSIIYDENERKWFSENCVDYDKKFDTYEELKHHIYSIKENIISKGLSTIDI